MLPNFFVEKFEENMRWFDFSYLWKIDLNFFFSLKQVVFTPPKEEYLSDIEAIFKPNKKAQKDPNEKKQFFKYVSCGPSFVYLIDGKTITFPIKMWNLDKNDLWCFGEGKFHNMGESKMSYREKTLKK